MATLSEQAYDKIKEFVLKAEPGTFPQCEKMCRRSEHQLHSDERSSSEAAFGRNAQSGA